MIKSNKGFSLFELIIVIAIMSITVGFAALSMTIVSNADVSKAANTYASALNNSKVMSMAKGTEANKIIITKLNGALYYQYGDSGELNLICSNAVDVLVKKGGAPEVAVDSVLGAGGVVGTISFNSAGMVNNYGTDTIDSLIFVRGNRRVETELFPETGKTRVHVGY